MQINRDHRSWAVGSAIVVVLALGVWLFATAGRPFGHSGGSWVGLAYGVAAAACMVFAVLLAIRRRLRTWRLGSAQSWLRAHLWLGLLAVPLSLLHGGFELGGPLTTWLMALTAVVSLSGVIGVGIQQFMPRMMTDEVPRETVLGQIDHVLAGLRLGAYQAVAAVVGEIDEAVDERAVLDREKKLRSVQQRWKQLPRRKPAKQPAEGAEALRRFYLGEVRPYLGGERAALPGFDLVKVDADPAWVGEIDRLAQLCDEARQLRRQRTLHRVMHGWLVFHAPVSVALMVLLGAHVVFALWYKVGG